jgi:ankyrin repeat protein
MLPTRRDTAFLACLLYALRDGDLDFARALGSEVSTTPMGLSREAAHMAVMLDAVDEERLALIAERCEAVVRGSTVLDSEDEAGQTSLWRACRDGAVGRVAVLLRAGAGVNRAETAYGSPPLYVASSKGHDAVVGRLLAAGADVDRVKTANGATPLCVASQEGHEAIVGRLLAAGADVDRADTTYGVTPLYLASQNGHEAIVGRLLAAGADVDRADTTYGATPLFVATGNGHEAIVRTLLTAHADPNIRRHDGWSPLAVARCEDDNAIIPLLLAAGAIPDGPHLVHTLPGLHRRVLQAPPTAQFVLTPDETAAVGECDEFGRTALHYACWRGAVPAIRALRAAMTAGGVDTNGHDGGGHRAVDYEVCVVRRMCTPLSLTRVTHSTGMSGVDGVGGYVYLSPCPRGSGVVKNRRACVLPVTSKYRVSAQMVSVALP